MSSYTEFLYSEAWTGRNVTILQDKDPASNWYWDLLYCNGRIKVIQTTMFFVYDNDQDDNWEHTYFKNRGFVTEDFNTFGDTLGTRFYK